MKTKEIELCGKKVMLGYCYATEIAYKTLADEDVSDFRRELAEKVNEGAMPDVRRCIYLIISAMQSYYEMTGEEPPIKDRDLMYEATPEDIGLGIGTVVGLQADFYHIGKSEAEKEQAEEKENKPKND
jgi:hypothetical protein